MIDDRFAVLLRRHLPYLAPDEPLDENTSLRDLGLDSMGMVELLSAVEGEYGIQLRDDALNTQTFATPATLWQAVSAVRT
ncbi:acyl carrier protein [Streptomyces sp. NPDC093094]|uniref:acyl carrier protein n=1 Tax=Streptomyces sp. NPDC093094 TaxID=3366026 RepID=UPI0037F10D7F